MTIHNLEDARQAHRQTVFELSNPATPEQLQAVSEHALRYGLAQLMVGQEVYLVIAEVSSAS